jgi:hypothetical protein
MSAHVAQQVEHFLGKEEVTGSIPVVGLDIDKWRTRHPRGPEAYGGLAREVPGPQEKEKKIRLG